MGRASGVHFRLRLATVLKWEAESREGGSGGACSWVCICVGLGVFFFAHHKVAALPPDMEFPGLGNGANDPAFFCSGVSSRGRGPFSALYDRGPRSWP